jgi:hypothetical protein
LVLLPLEFFGFLCCPLLSLLQFLLLGFHSSLIYSSFKVF